MWVSQGGDGSFLLLLDSPADLDVLCGGSFSRKVKFHYQMFMHEIFNHIVCVNDRQPWSPIRSISSHAKLSKHPRSSGRWGDSCFHSRQKWNFRRLSGYELAGKWNISTALEQWGLGQLKCSMGRIECYKRDTYHVGKHSRLTPRLVYVNFYLFFLVYIDLLVTFRVSQGFFSLFAFPKLK